MFYMGSSDNWFTRDGGTYVTSDVGVVYLPLNKTCLNLIHSKLSSFRTRFLITFLPCDELDEHILWNSLNGNGNLTNMVKNLCGKDPKKELRYCDFENLDRYLKSGSTLSNPSQLRIIKLSVLRNKTPGYNNMTCPLLRSHSTRHCIGRWESSCYFVNTFPFKENKSIKLFYTCHF